MSGPHPPFTELGQFRVHGPSVRLLGYEFCLRNHVVVLDDATLDPAEPVTVGMVHPEDEALVRAVSGYLSRPVRPVALNDGEVRRALDAGYDVASGRPTELALVAVPQITVRAGLTAVQIVDELLGHAVHAGASDLHVEAYEDDVDVRLRVDGVLQQVRTPVSHDNLRQVVARLKVLARLDVTERRRAQDGRIMSEYVDGDGTRHEVDFRLSVTPGPYGEDAVLRVLHGGAPLVALADLGFAGAELERFSALVRNPEGLILVTGPTGSGKTTTLYAAIHHINSAANKILTVEDPIEFQFDKVNQKQVSRHMGFADYARAFMRQNPDVILIGEIRDEATADTAVRAAQTGHLVLSTLHTIDATRTVTRLRTLAVDPDLLATTLLCALSQRLARKVCPHCREDVPPGDDVRRRLGLDTNEAFARGAGCERCGGDGLKGRTGVFEMFVPDAELTDLIAAGAPIHQVRSVALAKGMRSLFQDAMDKARAGRIPLSEVLRVVPYRMLGEMGGGSDRT